MTDVDLIKQMEAKLLKVAKHNNDEWKVSTSIAGNGYCIDIIETADRHTLIEVRGESVAETIEKLWAELPDALRDWGYTMPP